MYVLISVLALAFLLSFLIGYRRMLRLQHLNQPRVINGFLGAMIILTLMSAGQWMEIISRDLAREFTMLLYCLMGGFFFGFALKMFLLRQETKPVEYVYRSFWTEAAPRILAVLIIFFGIFQIGLIAPSPYTGIGIASGLSLLGFGCFGIAVKIVPEFRTKGVLILDQLVPWKNVVAYEWESEHVLQIDYYQGEKLTDFTTYIPPEDQLTIERLLGKKLKQYEQERKEKMDRSAA